MQAKHWMYAGCAVIAMSNALQAIGTTFPVLSYLSIVGIIVNTVSVPLTIIQAQKSTVESQQQFDQERQERSSGDQRVWEMTNPGAAHITRTKLLYDMGKHHEDSNS